MKQGQFEQLYQPLWQVIELQIIELEKPEVSIPGGGADPATPPSARSSQSQPAGEVVR